MAIGIDYSVPISADGRRLRRTLDDDRVDQLCPQGHTGRGSWPLLRLSGIGDHTVSRNHTHRTRLS